MPHRSIRLAACLGLLSAAVAATSCGSGAGSSAPPFGQAARAVPASSLAFVDVDLDRSSAGWRNLMTIGGRIPGWSGMVARLQSDLARRGPDGQSFDSTVEPWLGNEAAAAVTSIDVSSGHPVPVVEGYVGVRDQGALEHVLERDAKTAKVGASGGYTLYRERSGGAFAAVGSGALLLATSRAALRQEIALRSGRGAALAGSPAYRQALAALPGERVVTGFVNPSELASLLGLATAFAPPASGSAAQIARMRAELAHLTAVGFSASADPAGVRLAGVALGDAQRLSQTSSFRPALLRQVPAGALAVADLHGSPTALRAVQTLSGLAALGRVPGARVPPQLRAATVAMHDVLPAMSGEFAFDLLPGPGADLLATPARPAAAAAGLGRLLATLSRLIPHTAVARVPGGEQLVLPPAAGAMSIGWRSDGRLLVLGTNPSTARPAASLAADPAFASLLHEAGVPATVTGLLYLNVAGVASLSGHPPAGVRALGGLIAWGQASRGRLTGEIYLSVPPR